MYGSRTGTQRKESNIKRYTAISRLNLRCIRLRQQHLNLLCQSVRMDNTGNN
jgi:hypothetical protein